MMCLVQALCKLGSPDTVQGLYVWCKDVIGRKLPWVKAAVEKADNRYVPDSDTIDILLVIVQLTNLFIPLFNCASEVHTLFLI